MTRIALFSMPTTIPKRQIPVAVLFFWRITILKVFSGRLERNI